MSAIPVQYLKNMGTYRNIKVHGTVVTVIVDIHVSDTITGSLFSDFRSHVERTNAKVVGVDIKLKKVTEGSSGSRKFLLALYACNRCLIFDLGYLNRIPESAYDFLKSTSNICFVGPPTLFQKYFNKTSSISGHYSYYTHSVVTISWDSMLVEAGELAARVLKKPGLTKLAIESIAREVGVEYDGPANGSGSEVQVDSRNPLVLTEEMVKSTINDAVANYVIGCKLLSTISDEK